MNYDILYSTIFWIRVLIRCVANFSAALTMIPIAGDNGPSGLPHSPYPPGFGAAMAAAMANQQFASLMTSQGLPFMPHAIQAMYSSPTSKYTAPSLCERLFYRIALVV